MKVGLLSLASFLIVGCSANPAVDRMAGKLAQTDDPSKGIVCTYSRPVDSFLKEKRCTTPEQREQERLSRDTLVDYRRARDAGVGL